MNKDNKNGIKENKKPKKAKKATKKDLELIICLLYTSDAADDC